jgi:hypothetical protein
MCEKCVEVDVKIRRMREIALRLLDQQTLDAIAALVKDLEAQSGPAPRVKPPWLAASFTAEVSRETPMLLLRETRR